jgi:hypothetical protein
LFTSGRNHSLYPGREKFRIFFDDFLRRKILIPKAKGYGLENELDLDTYFQLEYQTEKRNPTENKRNASGR